MRREAVLTDGWIHEITLAMQRVSPHPAGAGATPLNFREPTFKLSGEVNIEFAKAAVNGASQEIEGISAVAREGIADIATAPARALQSVPSTRPSQAQARLRPVLGELTRRQDAKR